MRNLVTIVVCAGGLALASGASAQNWGRPSTPTRGACFYEDANFRGRYFCAGVGSTSEQVPAEINDHISSIRVFGNADVTVYRDARFRGSSRTFDSNVPNLRQEGFNDRISSYRVESQGFGRRARGDDVDNVWGRAEFPQTGACFYKEPNFGGDYFCSRAGAAVAQVPRGANDKISSVRVFGNVEVTVFRDSDYRGDSRTFDNDLRDLRRGGWNDLISSYRIEPLRFGRRGRRGQGRDSDGQNIGYTRRQAEAIVARAYRQVFDREPDPAASGWVDQVMSNGWTEQQLMNELRKSEEYRNRQRSR